MNRADLIGAEQVFQVGGNGGKSAAVHGNNHAEADDEQGFAAAFADGGNGEIQQRTEYEEDGVGVFASDFVGNARPQKASAHIKQAQEADEACRRTCADCRLPACGGFGKEFLNHHGCLAQYADAGGYVQAQYPEQQPKLRRFHGLGHVDMIAADRLVLRFRHGIAFRFPAVGRYADGKRAEHHQCEVKQAQYGKGFGNPDRSGV
nr:Uncharacterised protein [Neisseria gonorrhoeae]